MDTDPQPPMKLIRQFQFLSEETAATVTDNEGGIERIQDKMKYYLKIIRLYGRDTIGNCG